MVGNLRVVGEQPWSCFGGELFNTWVPWHFQDRGIHQGGVPQEIQIQSSPEEVGRNICSKSYSPCVEVVATKQTIESNPEIKSMPCRGMMATEISFQMHLFHFLML